jgi:hypothetical protein
LIAFLAIRGLMFPLIGYQLELRNCSTSGFVSSGLLFGKAVVAFLHSAADGFASRYLSGVSVDTEVKQSCGQLIHGHAS